MNSWELAATGLTFAGIGRTTILGEVKLRQYVLQLNIVFVVPFITVAKSKMYLQGEKSTVQLRSSTFYSLPIHITVCNCEKKV